MANCQKLKLQKTKKRPLVEKMSTGNVSLRKIDAAPLSSGSLTLSLIPCRRTSLSSSCFLYLSLLSFSACLMASCRSRSCSIWSRNRYLLEFQRSTLTKIELLKDGTCGYFKRDSLFVQSWFNFIIKVFALVGLPSYKNFELIKCW